ncbi:DUF6715 family protein [Butyrivibrio sp. YAB3001]|uniref:DUF6715 family protein n=1 Tax=Butyrivibrio sp. YAB3001 TaxID=1520812 RepID=UPI0008F627F7|nr:DUF6715 family protein [Butyrivibrio sp. YAB3001]SFC78477.1 hypothetical protein SAMN02910398_03154 [Butyrivibrio sp. YAB3001]
MESGTKSAIIKSVVLIGLATMVILGVFLLFTRNNDKKVTTEENYTLTAVDEITTTNLEKNYPADARMVVDFYGKVMKTLYKETYSDEQQDKMIEVLGGIMDDELMTYQNDFKKGVKEEVASRKEGDYSISSYVVQSKEPKVSKIDGKKMCMVDCLFTLRHGTTSTATYYEFVLRQDSEGRWKILGWTINEEKSSWN